MIQLGEPQQLSDSNRASSKMLTLEMRPLLKVRPPLRTKKAK